MFMMSLEKATLSCSIWLANLNFGILGIGLAAHCRAMAIPRIYFASLYILGGGTEK